MKNKPLAFMSYAHIDNKYGQLSAFRERLSNEVHIQTGEEFPIFQDRDDILLGQNWKQRINIALEEEITFLLPVISPSFFKSEACREELKLFLDREKELNRNDLVLPVYYVGCKQLDSDRKKADDELAEAIAARQWTDWRGLRFESFSSPEIGRALMQIAVQIRDALDRIAEQGDATPKIGKSDIERETRKYTQNPIKVYASYAHKDEALWNTLYANLKILMRQNLIGSVYDHRILFSEEPTHEVDVNLETADIILFLISPSFLASDYCYGAEMERALEKHETGSAQVIPVILRSSNWGGAPFAKLQALPTDGRPVTAFSSRDEAFIEIYKGIAKIATHLREKKFFKS